LLAFVALAGCASSDAYPDPEGTASWEEVAQRKVPPFAAPAGSKQGVEAKPAQLSFRPAEGEGASGTVRSVVRFQLGGAGRYDDREASVGPGEVGGQPDVRTRSQLSWRREGDVIVVRFGPQRTEGAGGEVDSERGELSGELLLDANALRAGKELRVRVHEGKVLEVEGREALVDAVTADLVARGREVTRSQVDEKLTLKGLRGELQAAFLPLPGHEVQPGATWSHELSSPAKVVPSAVQEHVYLGVVERPEGPCAKIWVRQSGPVKDEIDEKGTRALAGARWGGAYAYVRLSDGVLVSREQIELRCDILIGTDPSDDLVVAIGMNLEISSSWLPN